MEGVDEIPRNKKGVVGESDDTKRSLWLRNVGIKCLKKTECFRLSNI